MSKYLQDPDYLFSILTMIVKKYGGKIEITEDEIKNTTTGDLIGMYYEPNTGSIILKEVEDKDLLKPRAIINDEIHKKYEK